MDTLDTNLNGLDDTGLPSIVPGTANEIIAVNGDESGYILIPTENVIPEPISEKQILNSTAANVWDWSNNPKANSLTADTGAANGFKFDGTTSSLVSELNTTKIINNSVERVICTTTGVDLKGGVSVDSLITCPSGASFGVGIAASTTRMSFGTPGIQLTVAGTTRVNCTTSGVNITGSISQNNALNSNNFYGNTLFSNGTLTIDQNMNVLTSSTITLANGNVSSTGGQLSGYSLKASNAGTSVLAAVRVVDDNTGLYQSSTGNLDIVAAGTVGLNINSSRVQTNNILLFNRGPAFSAGVYSFNQSNSIYTSTQPLIIIQTPSTGSQDLDFLAATSYFGGQQFQIITRAVGAGTARYRAQSTTYHVTGGAAIVTIAANTYHTLVNDRYHILICNVDSNSFYLIQT